MTNVEMGAQIEGARAYETLFVPALFGQWSELIIDKSGLSSNHHVLDVACGTGALTRQIYKRVHEVGLVEGLDPNPGMLAVASEFENKIKWTQGFAEDLPHKPSTFDFIICQFGFMFFQDPAAALKEFFRVLKPGGKIILAVWDSIENIPGYHTEHQLIEEFAGIEAANAVAAPFLMGNKTNLQEIFSKAGANNIEIETEKGVARFPDIATMVNAELRGWLPIMDVNLEESLILRILAEAETRMSRFTDKNGSVKFDITAHIAVMSGG